MSRRKRLVQNNWKISLGLFFGFFSLYGFTSSSYLPPYRDAGEMAIVVGRLGVAHAPGYPLYTLIGNLFTNLPFGYMAYRINLFSALCGSLALVVLFWVCAEWVSKTASFLAVSVFGLSNPFWELSTVTEMYSLGVLWVTLLMYSAFVLKRPLLTALLMSMGLGVRMDMMLLFPIFVLWFFFELKFRNWFLFGMFFLIGMSVFLYMPIRSAQDPLIDWSNTETLSNLYHSLSRKSYGSTLDLLSLNYKKGENFLVSMAHYIGHISKSFGYWSWPLIGVGFFALIKSKPRLFLVIGSAFFITAPLFLFLANMPPNPHSIAIYEAAYPVPDLFLAIFLGFGIGFLLHKIQKEKIVVAISVCLLFLNASVGWSHSNRRNNLFARDYVVNAFRSSPRGAVVAFHEDVQLFSMWNDQVLDGKRKDLTLVSTGLSNSSWYWDMLDRWGVPRTPPIGLKSTDGFINMKSAIGPRPLVVGQETSLGPSPNLRIEPRGFLVEVMGPNQKRYNPSFSFLDKLSIYRGNYRYGEPSDFFSSDLISDYSRAYARWGLAALQEKNYQLSDWFLARSEALDPTFPRATAHRGYIQFKQNNYEGAIFRYQSAIRKHKEMLELASQYKSLPRVINSIHKELSEVYVYAGASEEKMGDIESARKFYHLASENTPNAQALYNLGVSYWNRDWTQVVRYMEESLKYNPDSVETRKYLNQALHNLNQGRN